MPQAGASKLAQLLRSGHAEILDEWIRGQLGERSRTGVISENALREESSRFLEKLAATLERADTAAVRESAWDEVRALLGDISRSRAVQGFTPNETAWFVFALKRPIFRRLGAAHAGNAEDLAEDIWRATEMLDRLGLHTFETFQKSREEIIQRQQQEMLELSTPVTQLWNGILAIPLIGTLDSARTQVVMENLLNAIVQTEASIAIIDITGVPTVDTLVAQHLLRTVAAARLMGAECIISGIRPQIAQTIVHLGVDLGDIATKATLADALRLGLARLGQAVITSKGAG